ncbi:MAG: hypothetical protein A2096_17685 [Spirochaetes bacterium GWF1_41_5]|nr:MAG: hypothetical protein A2096_17685 [Spirochaetes bacterium GWF1_41_5]HBE02368.1 hypothetical protein [Spirochaetia bacterium]
MNIKQINLRSSIAADIRSGIKQKTLKPGDRILPIRKLMKQYSAPLPTIQRAINDLVRENILETIHGKGTFIKLPSDELVILRSGNLFLSDSSQALINLFMKTYAGRLKNIRVREIIINSREPGFGASLPGFDLLLMAETMFREHQWEKQLLPVNRIIDEKIIRRLEPSARNIFEYTGKLYALPFAISPLLLFYNKDLLAKAGISVNPDLRMSFTEFSRMLAQFQKKSGGPGYLFQTPFNRFSHWFNTAGVRLLENRHKISGRAIELIKFLKTRLFIPGLAHIADGPEQFIQGNIPCMINNAYFLNTVPSLSFACSYTYTPFIKKQITNLFGGSFAVSRKSQHLDLCRDFFLFLIDDNAQNLINNEKISVPAVGMVKQDSIILTSARQAVPAAEKEYSLTQEILKEFLPYLESKKNLETCIASSRRLLQKQH